MMKKTKKWSINEDLRMYEEFPKNESLLEYIREDKSHEVVIPNTQE